VVPGEIVNGGEYVSDKTGRAGVDVAVGADEPFWDRAHSLDDAGRPRIAIIVRAPRS